LRFRIRTLLIVVAIASLVAFAVSSVMQMNNTIRNAYAGWWVGDMVVEHLRANNDNWPKNWDDLTDDYQTCVANTGAQPWEFDELRNRVKIDWDADPTELVEQQSEGKPQFKVIWLADGTNASWTDAEPNEIVLRYLNRKQ
jgi:hypothetical protein